jgi:hypothetical protein
MVIKGKIGVNTAFFGSWITVGREVGPGSMPSLAVKLLNLGRQT